MRKLRLLLLQFAAFTFGKQIMVTTRHLRIERRPNHQAERDACITAMLEDTQSGNIESVKAQARVFLNLPAPEWDEFQHHDSIGQAIWYSYYSQEYYAFRELAGWIVKDTK